VQLNIAVDRSDWTSGKWGTSLVAVAFRLRLTIRTSGAAIFFCNFLVLSCIQCTKNWTMLAAVCRTVFFLFAKAGKRISQSSLNTARIGEEKCTQKPLRQHQSAPGYREGEAEKYMINNNSWIHSRVQKIGPFRFILKLKPTIYILFLISYISK
jgi:hypothetical protein